MGKIEKLLDGTRRNGETKKWKMYVFAVVGILVVVGGFCGFIYFADVDGYLKNSKEIINLYDFYDLKVGYSTDAVILIGSSVVAESVYPPLINDILHNVGYSNVTVYTAFLSGDTPITRSTQLQKIIDLQPTLIIYGLMPRDIGANDWREEYYTLVHDRLDIRDDSLYLYTPDQAASFETIADLYYKKKYLKSAIQARYTSTPKATLNYSYDPIGEEYRKYLSTTKNDKAIIADVNNPNSRWRIESEVSDGWTQNKEALSYIITTFENYDIPVIIVNMPINPLLSEKISNESYLNYFTLLENSEVDWYNLDGTLPSDYFFDAVHMTFDGAKEFAPVLADFIIQELT